MPTSVSATLDGVHSGKDFDIVHVSRRVRCVLLWPFIFVSFVVVGFKTSCIQNCSFGHASCDYESFGPAVDASCGAAAVAATVESGSEGLAAPVAGGRASLVEGFALLLVPLLSEDDAAADPIAKADAHSDGEATLESSGAFASDHDDDDEEDNDDDDDKDDDDAVAATDEDEDDGNVVPLAGAVETTGEVSRSCCIAN